MDKDKKSRVWKGAMLGGAITAICKHLTYPVNMIVIFIALLALIVWMIKDRKKSNKYNVLGMVGIFVSGVIGILMSMGKLNDFSLRMQTVAGLGPGFLGIILIGVGNHIKNPEKVSKKSLIIGACFFAFMLLCIWVLFSFGSRNV